MIKPITPRLLSSYLTLLTFFLLTGCGSNPVATPAPQPTRDAQLEQSIEQQLSALNPAALPVSQAATQALDAGDYESSKTLYEQVLTLAPDFATAYRRLGRLHLRLNHLDRPEEPSRQAVA